MQLVSCSMLFPDRKLGGILTSPLKGAREPSKAKLVLSFGILLFIFIEIRMAKFMTRNRGLTKLQFVFALLRC